MQLPESLRLLGDRLDIYQIHSATAESGCLVDSRLLAALVDGRRRGAYRAVGFTLSGPASAAALEQGLSARIDGERVFDVVQATFNVLEPSLADGLRAAHESGVGVIAKEVFANGRLTGANRRPADASLLERLRAIVPGTQLDRVALGFVLAHPFVDVALSGAATVAQLRSHLSSGDPPLTPSAVDELRASAEPVADYWATRATLPWT
jgi:aryl-alcohol dehydrogenase-like predicted oxidoreductase